MEKKLQKIISCLVLLIIAGSYFFLGDFKQKEKLSEDVNFKKTDEVINIDSNSLLKIYFIDVGQADSILIENNGEYMLIDAGNNEDGKKLVSYLHSLGISNFAYVIGTHAHEDHIGGMDDVIKEFSIGTFYMPDVVTTTRTFEEVLDALEAKKIAYETPDVDSTFSFADCKVQVLYVGGDSKKDLNDTSIVLKIIYGKDSFLLMGDATNKIEKHILNKDLKSDVLKIGHHGSAHSTSLDFLDKVDPEYAIIEVGVNNPYHHPTKSTLKKLNERGIKIYRTDEDGTIILTSDGTNINFETVKTDTNGGE